MKFCKDCRHFCDAHYSRTYVSPTCTARGTDAASFMRAHVCWVDEARFYEPKDAPDLLLHPQAMALHGPGQDKAV